MFLFGYETYKNTSIQDFIDGIKQVKNTTKHAYHKDAYDMFKKHIKEEDHHSNEYIKLLGMFIPISERLLQRFNVKSKLFEFINKIGINYLADPLESGDMTDFLWTISEKYGWAK